MEVYGSGASSMKNSVGWYLKSSGWRLVPPERYVYILCLFLLVCYYTCRDAPYEEQMQHNGYRKRNNKKDSRQFNVEWSFLSSPLLGFINESDVFLSGDCGNWNQLGFIFVHNCISCTRLTKSMTISRK